MQVLLQAFHDGTASACCFQILRSVRTIRSYCRQKMNGIRKFFVGLYYIHINLCLGCDCGEMSYGVYRTANSQNNHDCIFDCFFGDDVSRLFIVLNHLNNTFSDQLTVTVQLCAVCQDRSITRKCHAKALGNDVHRVCGSKTCTYTRSSDCVVCHINQFLKGFTSACHRTNCLVNIIDVHKLTSHALAAQLVAAG